MKRWLTFSLALSVLSAEPLSPTHALAAQRAGTAIAPATLDSLRARIRRVMDSTKTPSIAVAVARSGRIIWEEGFGFAIVDGRAATTVASSAPNNGNPAQVARRTAASASAS